MRAKSCAVQVLSSPTDRLCATLERSWRARKAGLAGKDVTWNEDERLGHPHPPPSQPASQSASQSVSAGLDPPPPSAPAAAAVAAAAHFRPRVIQVVDLHALRFVRFGLLCVKATRHDVGFCGCSRTQYQLVWVLSGTVRGMMMDRIACRCVTWRRE